MIRRNGDDTVDAGGRRVRGGQGERGGDRQGACRGPGGAPRKGDGRANRRGRLAAGQGPPSSSILPRTPIEGRLGWDRRGYVVSKPPDCVEACRVAAALALSLTVAALSYMFQDILCLLHSGLVCTFLSEGGVRERGGWREAGLWDGQTAICRGEEGGAVPDRRGGTALQRRSDRETD